jgi:hypothetical protein
VKVMLNRLEEIVKSNGQIRKWKASGKKELRKEVRTIVPI